MFALFISRLTVLSILVALFPLVSSILYFLNSDNFLEECTLNIFVTKNHALLHYPCFYLELWLEYNNGNVYDTKRFLDIFCTITMIFTTVYVITSGVAVYGVVKEKSLAVIPWISANITLSVLMIMILSAELYLHLGVNFYPSEYFLITVFTVFYVTFNWIAGVIIISKFRKYPKRAADECSQFTYFELENINEET